MLAIGLGAVAGGLLFREVLELWAPVVMGVVGILCLAACFALTDHGETSPGRGFALGLLAIPVGIGFIGGIFGTTLLLVGSQFPVPSSPLISVAILEILGGLSIVIGCTIALFGFVLGWRDILDEPSLRAYTRIAFVTASAPVTTGLVLFVRVALGGAPSASQSPFGQVLARSVRVVFAPRLTHLHLGSFLFVFTVTGVSVLLFLRQVPVADLLAGDGNRSRYRTVSRLTSGLRAAVSLTGVAMVPAIVIEASVPPGQLQAALGPGLYAAIQSVTTAGALRVLLFGVVVVTVGWILVDSLLRQWAEWSEPGGSQWLGPFAAGCLLTVVAAATAGRVFDRILTETTARLPSSLALEVQSRVLPVVTVYGETAVVVLLAGVLVALAGVIGLSSWSAVYLGYLTDDGAGFSIASGGLLLGAIGLVVQGGPTWLVLGTVVVSLAVWDIGNFGAELDREIGPGESRAVEIVHASATLLVGAVALAAAFALLSVAPDSVSASPRATLAVACLGGGFIALSLALRDSVLG
ncbi:hypothetical protein GRX03_13025 [Halovenus sp. WSH3]|uniref:Uncharacterized protein n=1 Tax=Halovenus carboxidivorans TaxID=2692199 RepID=A0A6B0T8H6_9EURY|nr:hypothetical protein [Halovenus carboxidivorans]MXR52526.1 hypothetical protein [Halovenus carboxidivorans]